MERKVKRKSKVRILGEWIKLNYVENLIAEDGDKCWGVCHEDTRTIDLEMTMCDEMHKRTLNHEKMHMKLRLSGIIEILSEDADEALARLAELDD